MKYRKLGNTLYTHLLRRCVPVLEMRSAGEEKNLFFKVGFEDLLTRMQIDSVEFHT